MASKNDIKSRIKAVQNTQKVTKSMKLISIIKLKQVQRQINGSRDYNDQLANLIGKAVSKIDKNSDQATTLPALASPKANDNSICFVVISSDRGLCGPYNSQLFKFLNQKIKDAKTAGKKVSLILFGSKAISYAQRNLADCQVIKQYSQLPVFMPTETTREVAEILNQEYLKDTFSSVELVFNRFVSMIKSIPTESKLVPFQIEEDNKHPEAVEAIKAEDETIFEPGHIEILQHLIPLFIKNQLNYSFLSARAAELSSRVNAMSSASDNAKALINKLSTTYNKARQAAITQEISEIVAGAQSVN